MSKTIEDILKDLPLDSSVVATLKESWNAELADAKTAQEEKIREERLEQVETHQKYKNAKKELSADYILSGIISSVTDTDGKSKLIYYQVNLKLSDIKSNKIVWSGQKKIKKIVAN